MYRKILTALIVIFIMFFGFHGNVLPLVAQITPSPSLTGTITQMNNGQFTLQAAGRAIELAITNNTLIRLDGKAVMAEDLKPGMAVIVFAVDGKTATEVRASSPQPAATLPAAAQGPLTGTIVQVGDNQLTLRSSNRTLTITLTAATLIKVDGKNATVADLKGAMSAIIVATDGKPAAEIRAYTLQTKTRPATKPSATVPHASTSPAKPT